MDLCRYQQMQQGCQIKLVLESKEKNIAIHPLNLTSAPYTRTTPPFAHHYALQGREKEHPPTMGSEPLYAGEKE